MEEKEEILEETETKEEVVKKMDEKLHNDLKIEEVNDKIVIEENKESKYSNIKPRTAEVDFSKEEQKELLEKVKEENKKEQEEIDKEYKIEQEKNKTSNIITIIILLVIILVVVWFMFIKK